MEKEEELKRYRERYMGGLPEQLDTNLRILERIQEQIVTNQENLREAENRKLLIQQQISDAAKMELRNNGYQIVDENEDYILQCSLISLIVKEQRGVGFKLVYEGGIQINATLKDVNNKEVVWIDTVNGRSHVKRYATPEAVMEEALSLAMKDLMNNLVNDETLNAALKK